MNGRILPLAKLISLGVLLTLVVLIPGGQALAQGVLPHLIAVLAASALALIVPAWTRPTGV
jgi:hypothetical protein